jgi:hypothetical protein
MRRLALLLSLLALPVSAAVPTAQITGNQLLPDGSAPSKGTINCALSQAGSVTDPVGGTVQRVAAETTFTLTNGGALPSTAYLVPNDAITPSGTTYLCSFQLQLVDGRRASPWSERWSVASSPSSISIGAITRVSPPSGAVFVAGPAGPPGQSAVALNGTTSTPLVATPGAQNDPSASGVSVTTSTSSVGGSTAGGTDRALSAWNAFAFAPSSSTTGGVSVRLKKGGGVADGGSVSAYIYSDNSGVPGSDISLINTGLPSTTGLPTIIGTSEIGTTYVNFPFRIPKVGLMVYGIYWIVLKTQGISGGSIYIDSAAAGGNFAASAPDSGGAPGAWTTSAFTGSMSVSGSTGRGIYSYSPDGHSIEAFTDSGVSLYGRVQYGGIAVKGDAIGSGIGVGGTSYNGTGSRGSSNLGLGGQFISLGNYGGQLQGTGGAQLVATSPSAPAMQLVNLGGGNLLQGLDATNGYNVSAQIDTKGNAYFGSSVQVPGPVKADAVLNVKGVNRRTSGTQIVDGTTGTASLPPSAGATGKACGLVNYPDASHQVMRATWTSATSGQYTGCVFDGTWDLSAVSNLGFDLGFDTAATYTSVWVLLSSDTTLSTYANYSNSASLEYNATKRVRGWVPLAMSSLSPHGTPVLSAIKHIEIRLIRNINPIANPLNMYVYGVWTDPQARPKVLVSHDDGFTTQYTYVYPYMKAAGMHGTLYLNAPFLGTNSYMTLAQVKQMEVDGWAIGAHSWDHPWLSLAPLASVTSSGTTTTIVTSWNHGHATNDSVTIAGCDEGYYNGTFTITVVDSKTFTYTMGGTPGDTTGRGWCYVASGIAPDKLRMEIRRNAEALATNGFAYSGLHFAYPNGAWDPEVVAALRAEGYVTARTITSTLNGGNPWFNTFAGLGGVGGTDIGPWSLPAYPMDSSATSHTPANILAQVDSAIASGASIMIYGHSINPINGAAALCTAASTPYPCCTGSGTGTGCAGATEQYLGDFQAVIDGLRLRCITNNQCDVVSVAEWYNRL